jgi:UPF0755 protein
MQRAGSSRRRNLRQFLVWLGFAALIAILGAIIFFTYASIVIGKPFGEPPFPKLITIPKGETPQSIAAILEDNGIVSSKWFFQYEVRAQGAGGTLQAGIFIFDKPYNMREVIKKLQTEGKLPAKVLTIPEGSTISQIDVMIEQKLGKKTAFKEIALSGKKRYPFKFSGSIATESLEGYLFPDTYQFDSLEPGIVIKTQLKRFEEMFDDKMAARCKELGKTVHEIVTLASIIEKEGANADEMPIVSSVFWNRMRDGWMLQSDPTLMYVLDKHDKVLTLDEMAMENPYNTYKNIGLPPGPICNPGKTALMAALYPKETKFFFFVGDGKGHTDFSETQYEHERKMEKYWGDYKIKP